MNKNSKIYIAGHRGLVGSAIKRELEKNGYTNIIGRTSAELDLRNQQAVERFFAEEKPEYIFLAAAKVGGIIANSTYPAQFLYENLMIETNIIHNAYLCNAKKLLFLASSCIFPRECKQPMKEEYLLTGKLEPTNEAYAIAKIAGIKLCEAYNTQYQTDFISAMPCNIYGINDNFHPTNSHFVPALIRRFAEAKKNNASEVVVWGTGTVRRELLFADDLARMTISLMESYEGNEFVNVGTGTDYTVREVAETIKKVVGYSGSITFDTTKPDGMPQKVMDITKINDLGINAQTSLEDGLRVVYDWYLENKMQ